MKALFLILFFLVLIGTSKAQITNESELGLASANGNTKTETLNIKQSNKYSWRDNVLGFKSRYLNSEAESIETARFIEAALRYERVLTTHWNIFIGETYQQDKFAGYQNRYISDIGAKYFFIKTEPTQFFSELGYRYMDEERYDRSETTNHQGRFYTEWDKKWNENFSTKYWIEYIPNFSEPKDWMTNTEFSLSAVLTKIFSLKTGILLRYDHKPAPGVVFKEDTLLTTALVAKF